ncbi:MAG: putative NRPS-like protein biosynthetic cluster [Pycnora praestabilis]|nr:MAG: putative NRPS-like protein biosynthetic cluster [Pycnora praestabilis]
MNGTHAPGGLIGERLAPQVVDAIATSRPDTVWASVAYPDISQGFRDVTFKELAHAVDYMAWKIIEEIGRSKSFETIAYMGVSDIRYAAITLASIKCGYKILLSSVRNSESGNLSLLDELDCTKFFCSAEFTSKITSLKDGKPGLEVFTIPSFDEMLEGLRKPYGYEKTYTEARMDPVVICHTSGSTGAPKPIVLVNGYLAAYDAHKKLPEIDGRRNLNYASFGWETRGRFHSAFPPFHVAGIGAMCCLPVFGNSTVVLPPPEKPASGELLNQIMERTDLRALYVPPTVVEQLLQEPGGLEKAAKLDFVLSTGGPLSPSAGDRLNAVTDLGQFIGSTEVGIIPVLVPERGYWNYFAWHPAYGANMEHVAEDIYELTIPYDPSLSWLRCICRNAPETDEWRTKDLFKPHPTKPNLWKFHGRRDDIIVLSNGEKFNPVTMEGIIQGHPLLSGALIVGQGRFQAALLVEVKKHNLPHDELVEQIWPFVKKANIEGPAMAQIFRSKVLVASPEKPFHRVGKGTVIREATAKDYQAEVDDLYSGASALRGAPKLDTPYDLPNIEAFVRKCAGAFLSGREVSNQTDLYTLGLDSLQTLEISNGLKLGVPSYVDTSSITTKTIYAYPTIERLTYIVDRLVNAKSAGQNGDADEEARRVADMEAMVQKYTEDLPYKASHADVVNSTNGVSSSNNLTIVLTGSTGTLGTNLLQILLEDPDVSKIYCLNRATDAQAKHERGFAARGLSHLLSKSKVQFLTTTFGHPTFGQPESIYQELIRNVNAIVHNAWKVNFNHQLPSFEAEHIRGVRHFIDWSIASPLHPHILFVSSISSVANWSSINPSAGAVPEKPMSDYSVAQALGYAESKHVAERILEISHTRSGVPASTLRVGQVAGPTSPTGGVWNRHEFLPAMIQTSKEIGRVPATMQEIDWIPVDSMARIVVDLAHTGVRTGTPRVFHLVNPNIIPWSTFVSAIKSYYASEAAIEAVPLSEWIKILKHVDASDAQELARKPSVKILDFYEDIEEATREGSVRQAFETGNGVQCSSTMKALGPVDKGLMNIWLKQWSF